jgi:hypothetical protein
MPDEQDDEQIVCATYTHARRHPMVLGQIGGWTPPVQLTVVQIGVLIATVLVEVKTWRWWGAYLPTAARPLVFLAVPFLLAWAVRHPRAEGRSLPRTALGWLLFLSRPRRGRVAGRTYRRAAPSRPGRAAVVVAPGAEQR